jgi:FkbM family methyltransferase
MRQVIGKISRLTSEFLFVLLNYHNPFSYFRERMGKSGAGTLTLSLRNGIRYLLRANTNEVRALDEIWRLKIYDTHLGSLKDGSVVVDIGANIGIFSIKAARCAPGIRVFSYEPEPANFRTLQQNIALNHLEDRITALNSAVCEKEGTMDFFFHERDSGGGSIYPHDLNFNRKISVSCTTLEKVFAQQHISQCDFLKMDCEGAEAGILLQAPPELFRRIAAMAIEWHETVHHVPVGDMMAFLQTQEYEIEFRARTSMLYARRSPHT